MLTSGTQIRDFGRVLPWAASPPPERQPQKITDVLSPDALAAMPPPQRTAVIASLVQLCKDREPALQAMLRKMAADLEERRNTDVGRLLEDLADPDGEATQSCENAETYFRHQQDELAALRNALSGSGGPDLHGNRVFAAIRDLHTLFGLAIACLQEARWLVLMAEGGRGAPSSRRTFGSGPELLAAIQAEDDG